MEQALYITATIPREDGVGVEQRAFRNLKLLQKKYDTTVILINMNKDTLFDKRHIPNKTIIINLDVNFKIPDILNKFPGGSFLWFVSSNFRYNWNFFRSRNHIQQQLHKISNHSFFIVFFFRLATLWLHPFLRKSDVNYKNSLVDFDDIESIAKKRELKVDKERIGLQKYWASRVNILFTKAKENKALQMFDIVTVCSDLDKSKLERRKPKATILSIPNTIRTIKQLPKNQEAGRIELLFVGKLNYPPNIDAVLFFYKEIFPKITALTNLEVNLTIVGRDLVPEIDELSSEKTITIVENAPSVSPYYQKSHVVIVPLRSGGGTRLKILEAMSFGRPVISTTIGAEGLGAKNLEQILIADHPDQFSEACVLLAQDTHLYDRITKNARDFVDANFRFNSASIDNALAQLKV